MTPPRPTAPTAAEMRARFVGKLESHLASLSAAADAREDLDRLVAAVRAEALEKAALECDSFATSLDDRNDSDGEWMAEGAIECANRIRAMVSK